MTDSSTRICNTCNQAKPLEKFGKIAINAQGETTRRKICGLCRGKRQNPPQGFTLEELKAIRLANLARGNAAKKAKAGGNRRSPEAVKRAEQHRLERYRTDPAYRLAALERLKRYSQKQEAKAKKKIRAAASNHKRRVQRLETPENERITAKQWGEKVRLANGFCHWCGMKTGSLSMDHIVPLSKGGRHVIENVTPACCSCNSKKGSKLPHDWIGRLL